MRNGGSGRLGYLAAFAMLAATACGDPTAAVRTSEPPTRGREQSIWGAGCTECVLGVTAIHRGRGVPGEYDATFSADPAYEYRFVAQTAEGDAAATWVTVNGVTVIGPDEPLPTQGLAVPVELAQENSLHVRISGKPGSELVFWIEPVPTFHRGLAIRLVEDAGARVVVADPNGDVVVGLAAMNGQASLDGLAGASMLPSGSTVPTGVLLSEAGWPGAITHGDKIVYLDDWVDDGDALAARAALYEGGPTGPVIRAVSISGPPANALRVVRSRYLASLQSPTGTSAVMMKAGQAAPVGSTAALSADAVSLSSMLNWMPALVYGGGCIASELAVGSPAGCTPALQAAALSGAGMLAADDPFLRNTLYGVQVALWTSAGVLQVLNPAAVVASVVLGTIGAIEPRSFYVVSGDGQSAPPTSLLPENLVVRVLNRSDIPLRNMPIRFAIIDGGGTLGDDGATEVSVKTNADGRAWTTWTLGSAVADQHVSATTPWPLVNDLTFTAHVRAPGRRLLFEDDFSAGLMNWVEKDPDNLATWLTRDGELYGDYNIGCGSPGCHQSQLLLADRHQPAGDWEMEVRTGLVQAYCCYNGGAYVNLAKFALWVSDSEKEIFEVGQEWVGTPVPAVATSIYVYHQAYPWHAIGIPTIATTFDPRAAQTASLQKRGDTYTVTFNGQAVYSVQRRFSSPPKIGLQTYGGVRMDNFKLYEVPMSAVVMR